MTFGITVNICWELNFLVVPVHIILNAFLRRNKLLSLLSPKYKGSQWVKLVPSVDFRMPYFINDLRDIKSYVVYMALISDVLGNLEMLIPIPRWFLSSYSNFEWNHIIYSNMSYFYVFLFLNNYKSFSFGLKLGDGLKGPLWLIYGNVSLLNYLIA